MLTLIAVLALVAAEAPPPPKGTLCVLPAAPCVATTGTTAAVSPDDEERLFVWTSADEKRIVVGSIAPKAEEVSLVAEREIALALRGDASRGWPVDTKLELAMGSKVLEWTLPAKTAARLTKIGAPARPYRLLVKAPRHKFLERRGIDLRRGNASLGELSLEPQPAVRARVVDGKEKPLTGAQLFLADMKLCATANEQGMVRCELSEPISREVFVTFPGRAFKRIGLRELTAETDLGTVMLTEGATLAVTIERRGLEERKLTATLFRDEEDEYDHSRVASREVKAGESVVEFPDLAAGKYQLTLAGEGPLERMATAIDVNEGGTTEKTIRIEPYTLEGTVTLGGAKLEKGEIEIVMRSNEWRATLPIAAGSFGGPAWQHGIVSGFVRTGEAGTAELVTSPKLGTDPSTWTIALSERVIAGTVRDAETKAVVTRASMDLRIEFAGGGRRMGSAQQQPDGTYRIHAGRAGTYELVVRAEGYMPGRLRLEVKEGDRSVTQDVLLERGIAQPIEVVWADGRPVANASIVEGVRVDRANPDLVTPVDGIGRATLRGTANESRLLYVLPQEGSFAIMRLQIPARSEDVKPVRVTVPVPVGTIRAKLVDGNGEPARGTVVARYNGEWLPFMVLRFVAPDAISGPERLLPRLPAGLYELWGIRRHTEDLGVISSGGAVRPPVRVGLSTGEEIVEVPVP